MYDIVGVGHNCIDRLCTVENYPNEDGSTHITSIDIQGGGAVATALVAASRLGKRTAIIGPIGSDSVSKEITNLLEKDGVDCSNLQERSDAFGLQSFVMINPANGSRTKFPQRDNLPDIEWNEGLYGIIKGAKILHLDGTNHNNAMASAKFAKENGIIVSLDGCHLKNDNNENVEHAKLADILIMNAKYPLKVTGIDDYDKALLEISTWGPKIVICTLGNKGCKAAIDGKVENFKAFAVKAVDTTGAGDVFHGAFLEEYLEGKDVKECIRFAQAVSAIKCTKKGGRDGIPTKDAVEMFLQNN